MKNQKINISFDIEDIYGDQELLNNTLLDLLSFCDKNKISVDVYISAIKIPFLSEKIINLLKISKYLANKYNGLYIDVDGYSNSSIKAKIEAFLTLR